MSNYPGAIVCHRCSMVTTLVVISIVWFSHFSTATTEIILQPDGERPLNGPAVLKVIDDATVMKIMRQDKTVLSEGKDLNHRQDQQFLVIDGNVSCPITLNRTLRTQQLLETAADSITKFLPFIMPPDHNTKCYKHTLMYLSDLNDFKLWATKMFDASAKFLSSGWMIGNTYNLGNFDECIEIETSVNDEFIQGQYCLAEIEINPLTTSKYRPLSAHLFNESAWSTITELTFDPNKSMRNRIYMAQCIPHTCSSENVRTHFEGIFKEWPQKQVLTSVGEIKCQTKNEIPWTWGAFTLLTIIGLSLILSFVSTAYDLFTSMSSFREFQLPEKSKTHQVLQSFSLSRNVRKLLTFPKTSDNLECIHGLKFISTCFIIVGHRFMFSLGAPIMNTEFIETFYSKLEAMVILNGPILVDTFFIISGFLACYLLLEHIQNHPKTYRISLFYIHRYVRLTPVYAIVLAFYCTLLIRIGDGPMWSEKIGAEVDRCQLSWWTNILYINNYVGADKLCMIQSWYIACDTHLFLTAPIIVSLLYHKPQLGRFVLVSILVLSIATTFFVTYSGKLDAFLLVHIKILRDPVVNKTFKNLYIPTHTRATPYYIGMITGLVRHKMKHTSYKINKYIVWINWMLSITLMSGTLLSAWWFYKPDYTYDAFVASLYGALYRTTWATGVSWTIIAVSTGNGGFIEPLLCWKPVITLSRLTYCAFLCHGGLQLYAIGNIRTPYYASCFNLVWSCMGDITLSFLTAFGLTLLYESPILGLEKIVFSKVSGDKPNYEKNIKTTNITNLREKTDRQQANDRPSV
ncbi:nose resistant to fluoxetine protein 6-like [Daktulosphaira vitifoliae]|uniref:nose resistant to fluoxetine protein 6-like n=1 Tax=Daktulosphaira vitifoliae TaxID=58002 RepID=UPI0021A9FA30|nr:nose resistant to fluoxetine protein 6-like [Daktulosphaira vitifoliae]XP_050523735.1 nose resistant to fluoxetine protein 6-like [Daktulosphaira vitifoliae]